MNPTRVKFLGTYVSAAAILQLGVYLTLSFDPDNRDWLFYFDPRFGLFHVETILRGVEPAGAGILQWLSALWLAALGVLLIAGRAPVVGYVISEILLAAANVTFFATIIRASMSSNDSFPGGELFFPIVVTLFVTATPLWLAFRCFYDAGTIEPLQLNAGGRA